MSVPLDARDRAVVNAYQGGFPIEERPFEPAAMALSEAGVPMDARELLARLQRLDERGVLSRFGPLIDADALGGTTTLVAARVPEERFDAVAERVNEFSAVAHNYERDHELNMWFVLSVADPASVPAVLEEIEAETRVETYELPKREEFYLRARFPVLGPLADEPLDCSPSTPDGESAGRTEAADASPPSRRERALLAAVQDGLPLTPTPYADLADDLDESTAWVVDALARLLAVGTVRRVGAIPNHYALGYTDNAMTVWDVPDDRVNAVGRAVGALPFVTHCYRRPRHDGIWPYNLFAMVHGRTAWEAESRVDAVEQAVTEHCSLGSGEWETLYSVRILKKAGIRLGERDATEEPTERAADAES